jgi:hypothetical protein
MTMPFDEVQVITVNIPGDRGPAGPQGNPGPSNVLTIGTVTTSAPGSAGGATISGVSPTQTLNLTIPQGPVGPTGPANTLTIGTVNTVDAVTGGSATITGTVPNQILNLVLPRGYGVIPAGATGAILTKKTATDYDTQWSVPASAATVSAIMQRDAAGRAQVVDPSVAADIATKNYVDTHDATASATGNVKLAGDLGGTAALPTVTGGTHHTHTSSQISDAASAATVSKVIIRDAAGRAQVVDPSVAADISTKGYADANTSSCNQPAGSRIHACPF